jgi:hypothetical protein
VVVKIIRALISSILRPKLSFNHFRTVTTTPIASVQFIYSLETFKTIVEVPLLVIYNLMKQSSNDIKNEERGVEIKIQHPYVPLYTNWYVKVHIDPLPRASTTRCFTLNGEQ